MALTKEERARAKIYAANGAEFMFEPYSMLCDLVIQDSPDVKGIDILLRDAILERKSIRLHPKMVIRYCNYELDKKNTFMLDNGDIRVVPPSLTLNKENYNES